MEYINEGQQIQKPKNIFWTLNISGWFAMALINILFQTKYLTENFDAFQYTFIVIG